MSNRLHLVVRLWRPPVPRRRSARATAVEPDHLGTLGGSSPVISTPAAMSLGQQPRSIDGSNGRPVFNEASVKPQRSPTRWKPHPAGRLRRTLQDIDARLGPSATERFRGAPRGQRQEPSERKRGLAQPGRPGSGPRGRRFESCLRYWVKGLEVLKFFADPFVVSCKWAPPRSPAARAREALGFPHARHPLGPHPMGSRGSSGSGTWGTGEA